MGRAQGVCRLCPDGRRQGRNRAHRDDPVQHCAACGEQVCGRHVVWDSAGARWLCRTCDRLPRPPDAPPEMVVADVAPLPVLEECGAPKCGRLQVAHGFCLQDQWRARR